MITRAWKVYGVYDGEVLYANNVSFYDSFKDDFSKDENVRKIECFCSDKTGTNDFVIVKITRNTAEECLDELNGQITDGIFENCQTGEVEEVNADSIRW